MPLMRRVRGSLLRVVRRRVASIVIGLLLAVPAAWTQFRGSSDRWWVEGLSLVGVAAGIALIWTGLFGLKPDWEE
jgi:hypothetical protein